MSQIELGWLWVKSMHQLIMATEWTIETLKSEMVKAYMPSSNYCDGSQVCSNARRFACMYFKFPDDTVARGQPPDTIEKYNELVKTLTRHYYDTHLKGRWKPIPEKLANETAQHYNRELHIGINAGLWTHESKINELIERMETLEKTNKILKTKVENFNILFKRVEQLEVENKYLKNCIIDKSKCALVIQRYWKKYLLIKRIKEASKVFKFTRNFSHFVNPVEILEDLIDCRSAMDEPITCSPTFGRKHRGPHSVTSEMSTSGSVFELTDY